MTDYILVASTAGDLEEAGKIADALVAEKICACVQVMPITSTYMWKGKIERETEHLLLAKTRAENYGKVEDKIKELHSYDCPEVIALPIKEGSEDYLKWVKDCSGL